MSKAWRWLIQCALLSSCAEVLSLDQALPSSACVSENDCAPGESCELSRCSTSRCEPSQTRCHGLDVEQCDSLGKWRRQETCTAQCSAGACETPRSCATKSPQCAGDSCCRAFPVEGGQFELVYSYRTSRDDTAEQDLPEERVTRTVRAFVLDRFEVTWSRFAPFVFSYPEMSGRPDAGAGAHPAFLDSGWQEAWTTSRAVVPDTQRALENTLNQAAQYTRSDDFGGELPVRGVNWYMAMAFCIWDGGRLPTEAEWSFTAANGSQQRLYPWPDLDFAAPISHREARFSDETETYEEPAEAGAHPEGHAELGHDDLAGNLAEWVIDTYRERLPEACASNDTRKLDEHECLAQGDGDQRVVRGGSFRDSPVALRNTHRSFGVPDRVDDTIGFRCARDFKR